MNYISLIGDTGLIACVKCKVGILPSRINSHFQGNPHQLDPEIRQKISSEIAEIPGLIRTPSDLDSFEISSSFPYFFPCLPVFVNRFLCEECQFVSKDRKHIVSHFSASHNYQNPRKKGERYKETGTFVP